uniref:EOG090X0OE5 n=1 Tax=Daphnia barbata TaxID=414587 RepID=A0A4Y7M4D6_9CRUS|nr:EOG090X0OE5 [Daphnia barbata]
MILHFSIWMKREILEWAISRMHTFVLPEIAKCGEEFHASGLLTLKGVTIVYSLMSFQPVECIEVLFASQNIAAIWTIFGVYSNMDFKTVGIEKSLTTFFFSALEGKNGCANLCDFLYELSSFQQNCRKQLGLTTQNVQCKFFRGHCEILPGSCDPWPKSDTFVRTNISLVGGKGGFGSMLRAIGAQIEKTTNREACRDLSGRRLRDINEEKRLKDWVSKQADREKEREERKQKKLEKLRQEYHHEFHDPEYFRVRSEVLDNVNEALEQGIQASSSTADEPPPKKHRASDGPAMKKTAFWIGVSDDESDSSEDEGKSSSTSSHKNEEGETRVPEISCQAADDPQAKLNEAPEESVSPSTPKKANIPSTSAAESAVDTQPAHESLPEEPAAPSVPAIPEQIVACTPTAPEPTVFLPINLLDFSSSKALESLGLNHLKHELQRLGLKCGGSLSERASRLFSIKGLSSDEIDPSLLAKPPKK